MSRDPHMRAKAGADSLRDGRGGLGDSGGAQAAKGGRAPHGPPSLFDESFLKKLEYLYIVSRKVFAGRVRAERRSRKVGSGIEFADHRDYAPGDDVRYLDWNLYGRLDKLLLRLFEEEEDLHIYLLVDTSASMRLGAPPKIDYAAKVAAALCYIGLSNLDRVSLVTFADTIRGRLPPARGKGRIFKVFDFLNQITPAGSTRVGKAVDAFVRECPRPGVAVVISDFYDHEGYAGAFDLLRYHRFEPYAVQVFDEGEARPSLRGDLTVVDCETGEEREVTVSARLLAEYARVHEAWCRQVQDYCTARAIPFFRAETTRPFDELVLTIFRAGGFLK